MHAGHDGGAGDDAAAAGAARGAAGGAGSSRRRAEWKAEYAVRAGIEGTLSQGVRGFGLRRCRYIGLAKARLQHVATAAAINVYRISDWVGGVPPCGDADVAVRAAGGLIGIRQQYPLLLTPPLTGDHPEVRVYRWGCRQPKANLGDLLAMTGPWDEAATSYRDAISLQKQIVRENPIDSTDQTASARSSGLGNCRALWGWSPKRRSATARPCSDSSPGPSNPELCRISRRARRPRTTTPRKPLRAVLRPPDRCQTSSSQRHRNPGTSYP